MDNLTIFEHVKERLLAFSYEGESCDCFQLCFKRWSDVEYLEEFFEENKSDLAGDFWSTSVEDAVLKTLEESRKFKKIILNTANNKSPKTLDELFQPLTNKEKSTLERNKSYGPNRKSWLRIYAIRFGRNCFIITGGAIKLTATMGERDHTENQLDKLNIARDYLKSLGIEDDTDLGYLEIKN